MKAASQYLGGGTDPLSFFDKGRGSVPNAPNYYGIDHAVVVVQCQQQYEQNRGSGFRRLHPRPEPLVLSKLLFAGVLRDVMDLVTQSTKNCIALPLLPMLRMAGAQRKPLAKGQAA